MILMNQTLSDNNLNDKKWSLGTYLLIVNTSNFFKGCKKEGSQDVQHSVGMKNIDWLNVTINLTKIWKKGSKIKVK